VSVISPKSLPNSVDDFSEIIAWDQSQRSFHHRLFATPPGGGAYLTALTELTRLTALTADRIDIVDVVDSGIGHC
jgi:hypothetical protein